MRLKWFLVFKPFIPGEIRQIPTGDRFDGVGISSLDGLIKNTLIDENNIICIDSGAGQLGSMMQIVKLTDVIIVPSSLSWTDLRPTLEFIHSIDELKQIVRMIVEESIEQCIVTGTMEGRAKVNLKVEGEVVAKMSCEFEPKK